MRVASLAGRVGGGTCGLRQQSAHSRGLQRRRRQASHLMRSGHPARRVHEVQFPRRSDARPCADSPPYSVLRAAPWPCPCPPAAPPNRARRVKRNAIAWQAKTRRWGIAVPWIHHTRPCSQGLCKERDGEAQCDPARDLATETPHTSPVGVNSLFGAQGVEVVALRAQPWPQ